jgi:hypothetical protein
MRGGEREKERQGGKNIILKKKKTNSYTHVLYFILHITTFILCTADAG